MVDVSIVDDGHMVVDATGVYKATSNSGTGKYNGLFI